MKKQLLLLVFVFGLIQFTNAQSGNVLSLPGGSVTTSKMAIPPLNTLITAYPFTVEMWVKPNTITAAGGFWVDRSGSVVSLQFTNNTNGAIRNDIFGTQSNGAILDAVKPAINAWHHLSMIARADSVIVECDGNFYAALNTKTFLNTFCSKFSHIGVDSSANNSTRTVSGFFDEIRFWNTARTREEIQANKSVSLAGNEAGLVAYYNFEDNTANDKTANAKNALLTGGTIVGLNTISTLSNISISGGTLSPAFSSGTTTYTVYAPADVLDVTVTGIATAPGVASISNNPAILNASNPTVTMVCTSGDGLSTTSYTINYVALTLADWEANGATGPLTYPNMWGWANTTGTAIPWNFANGSGGARYRDYKVSGGHTGFLYEGTNDTSKTRQLMLRFDNAAYSASYYSFPVILEACKTYDFDWDYVLGGSATPPSTITVGIDTTKNGTGRISSKIFTTTSNASLYRHGKFTFSTGSRAGIYYLTINAGAAGWYGITNLALAESTLPIIVTTPRALALSDVNKSAVITVRGNALTNDVILTAPAGITLSRTTVPVAETQCGGKVTVTYDYSQNIASGIITMASGIYADTITFTYTKPTISFYERKVEVEDNGRSYPLNIKSVGNSVDSIYASASTGFSVVKAGFSAVDFTSGSGSIDVQINSSAANGAAGKLIFYTRNGGNVNKLDSVEVKKVAAYTRYYIKQKVSGMVIGNHSSSLYPALTANVKASTQKFFLRKVNNDPAAVTDTFYIVQDDAYRVMRKSSNNWDTEFGIPSNDAKWTRQSLGTDTFTITNVVTNKVLGADATAADSRLYDDKAYNATAAGQRTVWSFIDAAAYEDATLASLSLSTGTLNPEFSASITTYSGILATGTITVTPTATPAIVGATVTGTDAVDVSSGSGVSTIVVTALDGTTQKTYTINYSVATGLNIAKASAIKIYPAVSNRNFTVETVGKLSTISVYDFTGKVVSKQVARASSSKVSISKAGIYLIKVECMGVTKVVKVVKTN